MTAAVSPRLAAFFLHLRGNAAAALVLAALLVVFFREPILRYSEVTYTTADLTQNYSLTKIDREYTARNVLLSDPVTQFVPWLMFNKSELLNGRLPLWNPYNGCGAPHLANYQSAVFSPFSLLFYACSLKLALLASAFLKLFLAGFGTFLFLRLLALSWLPALLGGAIFMFSGHNVLLVAYPHAGVIAFMPFTLLCAESLLQAAERDRRDGTRTRRTGTWLLFVLLLTAAIYAGHPETLYFAVGTVALWTAVRLCTTWWPERRTLGATSASARIGVRFVVAALLAAGLGAPQLLPFVEYLGLSAKLAGRSLAASAPVALDGPSWPRYFFPDLLGSPGGGHAFKAALPPPNYEAANLGYVGAVALLLALMAVPRAIRDRRFALFVPMSIAWVLWAHDVAGVARVVALVPLLRHVPIPVSQGPWVFGLACLAAFALDQWLAQRTSRRWLGSALTSIAGMLVLWIFHAGARAHIAEMSERVSPAATAIAASEQHLNFVAATCLLALTACAAIQLVRSRTARVACAAVVLAAACAQTGWLLSFHNTSCEDRFVYPLSPAIERVRNAVGGDRVLVMGREGIPPCTNLAYGLARVGLYDGLAIRSVHDLYVHCFEPDNNWHFAFAASEQGLRLFGIEWILKRINQPSTGAANAPKPTEFHGDTSGLAPLGRVGQHEFFRYTKSLGPYWLVPNAKVPASEARVFEQVTAPEFDPGADLVLGPDPPADFGAVRRRAGPKAQTRQAGRVVVLEQLPRRVRLRVEHERDDYLVLTLPWYPGWTATVDGRHAPLARANYAFSALDVPAGEHEIELGYEPRSWSVGLRLALASLVLLAMAALVDAGALSRLRAR